MGLLKKLADRQNWSKNKRRTVNIIMEILWWLGWVFIIIKASECTCVEGTIPIQEFNDCYVNCMADMNNPSACGQRCISMVYTNYTGNESDLDFSVIKQVNDSIIS